MLATFLVSIAVALQGAPAKPAAKPVPIAAAPADASGPMVEVPASLARLAGPDTIAVIYMPSAARAEEALERLRAAAGSMSDDMPLPLAPMKRQVAGVIRTELEIPLDQPVLWWIVKPELADDEPGMGMGSFVMHQAIRIPGATAAQEKARAEAAGQAGKARPAMPVRSARRGASVTVLADDFVVTSSDMEPFVPPADGAGSSPLARSLPRGVVSGRVDLGRVLEEEGDQLRMLAGFASMSMGGDEGDEASMTPEEKRRAEMRRTFADGVGVQINSAIDSLMQLRRASFSLDLEGDALEAWADWSRDAAFPAGLSEERARALAERLPAGHSFYAGVSANALDTLYGDRVSLDDAIATMGATPEARQAWTEACARTRAMISMIEDGAVMCVDSAAIDPATTAAFRVKEPAAFRAAVRETAALYQKAGLATTKVEESGETLRVEFTPSADRLREIVGALADEDAIDAEAMQRALQPSSLSLAFRGNEVLLTQARDAKPAPKGPEVRDLRGTLGRGAWGGADWFLTVDLRSALGSSYGSDAEASAEVERLRKGKPAAMHLWQGVKGSTARLSVRVSLSELQALAADVAAVEARVRAAVAKPAADAPPAAAPSSDPQ
jgi:hypothetical protein